MKAKCTWKGARHCHQGNAKWNQNEATIYTAKMANIKNSNHIPKSIAKDVKCSELLVGMWNGYNHPGKL